VIRTIAPRGAGKVTALAHLVASMVRSGQGVHVISPNVEKASQMVGSVRRLCPRTGPMRVYTAHNGSVGVLFAGARRR
jgi:ABC-type cobalamin transport system ATPase subunit